MFANKLYLHRTRQWTRQWHAILETELGTDPSFGIAEALSEPACDFRMHFSTWELSDDALRRCFAMLPQGAEMAQRAITMRALRDESNQEMTEKDALDLFQSGLDAYAKFSDDPELREPIQIKRVNKDDYLAQVSGFDFVRVALENVRWNLPPAHRQAEAFLSETLYRLKSSYGIADYISWPLTPGWGLSDPHQPFAMLDLSDRFMPALGEAPVLIVRES